MFVLTGVALIVAKNDLTARKRQDPFTKSRKKLELIASNDAEALDDSFEARLQRFKSLLGHDSNFK